MRIKGKLIRGGPDIGEAEIETIPPKDLKKGDMVLCKFEVKKIIDETIFLGHQYGSICSTLLSDSDIVYKIEGEPKDYEKLYKDLCGKLKESALELLRVFEIWKQENLKTKGE